MRKYLHHGYTWAKTRKKRLAAGLSLVVLLMLLFPTILINLTTQAERFDAQTDVQKVHQRKVAIVLGAGVFADGTPTPYLANRIKTSVELYKAGRVQQILMSGDNSSAHYNEPTVMKNEAVKQGVPAENIFIDYAGFSTYDTCYRAKHIFGVQEATVVSQGYHVPRAVFTCQQLGINTVGVGALRDARDFTVSYLLRELVATNKAIFEVSFKPKPTVLGTPAFLPN